MNQRKEWIEENTNTFLRKLSNGEKLDEDEVRWLIYEEYDHSCIQAVDSVVIDEGRWTNTVMKVFTIPAITSTFAVYYDRARTEIQEDEFWEQVAREVEPVPITKIEWREVE